MRQLPHTTSHKQMAEHSCSEPTHGIVPKSTAEASDNIPAMRLPLLHLPDNPQGAWTPHDFTQKILLQNVWDRDLSRRLAHSVGLQLVLAVREAAVEPASEQHSICCVCVFVCLQAHAACRGTSSQGSGRVSPQSAAPQVLGWAVGSE